MVKQIKFHIAKDGQVSVSVEGASGAECEALTKPFEDGLGLITKRTYKDSYYRNESETLQEVSHDSGD